MSRVRMGGTVSPEVRAKIAATLTGRKLTAEHRARIGAGGMGRKASPEVRAAQSVRMMGNSLSPDARARIGAAHRGWHPSPEARAKMSRAHTGMAPSAEARAKASASQRGRKMSAERRAKLSASVKARLRNHGVRVAMVRRVQMPPVKGECVYCGAPAKTWDHVLPRSRGGTNDPGNLVLACGSCNCSKGFRTPDEWLAAGLKGRRGASPVPLVAGRSPI